MEGYVNYQAIIDYITQRLGIVINAHRRKPVETQLRQIQSQHGLATADALLVRLQQLPDTHPLWHEVINAVTIGETYFFRNQAHMQALKTLILPQIIKQKRASQDLNLRVWSAGCATGEEPYSIAMLLNDLLPDKLLWQLHILGTDINYAYLARAKEGIYRPHTFRKETPTWLMNRWFDPVEQGMQLKPEVRQMVQFAPLNLITGDFPANYNGTADLDMIICRNVTIYFTREQTQRLVDRFYAALKPGGWLIVGHSEPQPVVYDAYEVRNLQNTVVYQKPAEQPCSQPVAEPTSSWMRDTEEITAIAPLPKADETTRHAFKDMAHLWVVAQAAADREAWGEAFQLLDEAERHDMLRSETYYLRALMLMQLNDFSGAERALRQVLYCDSLFALAHYMLGEIHQRKGYRREARRHWLNALQALEGLQPDDVLAMGSDISVIMLKGLLDYRLQKAQR